jgi:hypothetical protein
MRPLVFIILGTFLSWLNAVAAESLPVISLTQGGSVDWTNALVPGICILESAPQIAAPWMPYQNFFSTTARGDAQISFTAETGYFRVHSVDVSATPDGFTNLVQSYGRLETIAGAGAGQSDISYWQPWFEGWPGQWVALSRPHFAMADRAGNVFIADKNSHAILRVSPSGILTTVAGTHTGGFNGDGPAAATSLQLNYPNGEWIRGDGTIYVLDTNNGRVRRVDTNGIMTTLFLATPDGSALDVGRGLWVADDESLACFCAGTKVKQWTPAKGVKTLASNFTELGDLIVDTGGNVIVCDRGASLVYRISASGDSVIIAGNGTDTGGGDGFPALQTGLYGVRSVWPVPTGGFLLLTHEGCQLWYLDTSGIVRLLLNGGRGRTHAGDGSWFYSAEQRISEGRSVTMDYDGNILVCESDYGYVRRIQFRALAP